MNWILGKMSAKAILWVALVSIGLNVVQYTWHKITTSNSSMSKEFVELAVNDALQKQQQSQYDQTLSEQDEYIKLLEDQSEVKDKLIIEKQERGDRWKHDALNFKNKYLEIRCEEGDTECKAWGSADYRGDG